MKIISISDKEGSAIDRICKMQVKRLPHLEIAHMAIHPKRPEADKVTIFRELLKGADIVDCQYWKTAVTLRKLCPEMESKKLILTHHNEHNIDGDWEWKTMRWDMVVAKNKWQHTRLTQQGYKPQLIRHCVEMDALPFAPDLTREKVVGYVGQIKKVKGVRELKRACDELGYRLLIVGNPSEAAYWEEMNKDNLLWLHDVPDAEMASVFAQMRVYCANSDDGTESGTLPILEAMSSGIPVVTRNIGLVRDCGETGKNMIVREGKMNDVEDLKAALLLVMENEDIANELRENGWRTVRQYHPEVAAREYDRLYHTALHGEDPLVSVVMPTANRIEVLADNIISLIDQTYQNFELIVADDSADGCAADVVAAARKKVRFPIKYVWTAKHDPQHYGLAEARNRAIIESLGKILIFCDDRLKMHPNAIGAFVRKLGSYDDKKVWVWGSKGTFKSFVENFSAAWRRQVIDGGMFSERIDEYGGMTQEISGRFGAQGFRFDYCPEALAEPLIGTHSKSKNREQIIRSKIKLYKMGFQ